MPVAKKIQTKACPACQSAVTIDAKFCNFCGQRITPDVQLEPIEHKQAREQILDELAVFLKEKNISSARLQDLQNILSKLEPAPKPEVLELLLVLSRHTNRHIYTAAWLTLQRVLLPNIFMETLREALNDQQVVPVVLTALPLDQQLAELLWPAVQASSLPWVKSAFLLRASSAHVVLSGEAKRAALSL